MTRQPALTRATLLRWLAKAFQGEQSAVIAEASQALGNLEAVYTLLNQDRSREVS
jgi:hypothetical protein